MDFTCLRAPWLRELAERVCWTRLTVEAISPGVAWRMISHVAELERWAGDRLGGPDSLTRELLLDYLAHVRAGDLGAKAKTGRLSAVRMFLDRARIGGTPIASSATYLAGEIQPQRAAGVRGGSSTPARSPSSTIPATSPACASSTAASTSCCGGPKCGSPRR